MCGSAGKYYEENMKMFGELRQVKALSDEQQAGQTTADRSMIGVDGHMTSRHMTGDQRRPRTKIGARSSLPVRVEARPRAAAPDQKPRNAMKSRAGARSVLMAFSGASGSA